GISLRFQHAKSRHRAEGGDTEIVLNFLSDLYTSHELQMRMCEYAEGIVRDKVGTVGNAA
ncbi:hypothetical protein HOY82DRAFT_480524, partial [Tuber indicum]